MEKEIGATRKNKILLDQYEVSVFAMMGITLLPTFGILFIQVIGDVLTNSMSNYRIYAVTAVVFLILLMISGTICRRYAREVQVSGRAFYAGCILVFVIHILLLMRSYVNSTTVYPAMSGEWFPWHSKTNWKMFVFMAGIGGVGILVCLWAGKQRKVIEWIRYPAYLLASVFAGASMYAPNWMAGDRMHGSAYYTSVYNALMDAPYTYSNQSIYGHYAILLKYPIKLLGGDYAAFNIVISIVGGLSLLFLAFALDICVKNHFLSIIGVWAVPMMFLYYPLNHWQMFPHRVIFAAVLLYLITLCFHRQYKWVKPLGYFACIFSLLWNVETGIVCLGVWALTCIVKECFYVQKLSGWKEIIKSGVYNAVYSVLSLIGTLGIFNLYNMSLGEKWHGLKFFLYPLVSGWDTPEKFIVRAGGRRGVLAASKIMELLEKINSGFAAGLANPLPYQISSWYFVLFLMGLAIILFAVRAVFHKEKANDYIMALAAVLAMGHLIYFFNRACFDYLAIAFFEAILIMAVIADEVIDKDKHTAFIKTAHQYLFISVLSVLSVMTVWQIYFRFAGRIADGYYDTSEMEKLAKEIEEVVPKDTYAFGMGIQEIYAQLGWDTNCYLTDFLAIDCTGGNALATLVFDTVKQDECVVCFRSNRKGERETVEHYMQWWCGYIDGTVEVKALWDLEFDENWYWNVCYLKLDGSKENSLFDHYKALEQREDH